MLGQQEAVVHLGTQNQLKHAGLEDSHRELHCGAAAEAAVLLRGSSRVLCSGGNCVLCNCFSKTNSSSKRSRK